MEVYFVVEVRSGYHVEEAMVLHNLSEMSAMVNNSLYSGYIYFNYERDTIKPWLYYL